MYKYLLSKFKEIIVVFLVSMLCEFLFWFLKEFKVGILRIKLLKSLL